VKIANYFIATLDFQLPCCKKAQFTLSIPLALYIGIFTNYLKLKISLEIFIFAGMHWEGEKSVKLPV
jgi:hypothetical protein